MTMKRNVAKNYVKAMCACIMFALSMAVIPTYASAQPDAGSVAPCRLVTADVLDTYKSFFTANHPSENIDCFDQTYKRLSFKTSYSRTGQTILYTGAALSPRGNGMPGFETKYQCTYRTW